MFSNACPRLGRVEGWHAAVLWLLVESTWVLSGYARQTPAALCIGQLLCAGLPWPPAFPTPPSQQPS